MGIQKIIFKIVIPLFLIFIHIQAIPRIQGQEINTTVSPKMKIEYWLSNYHLAQDEALSEKTQQIFERLLAVADKPDDVLPRLYIFEDLHLTQIFALPDGSIILPGELIDFCYSQPGSGAARVAFLLGHELKHILKKDYWKVQQIEFFARKSRETGDATELNELLTQEKFPSNEIAWRKQLETRADEYGILYASLAGYDVSSIISPDNSFISDFYRQANLDVHGDLKSPSLEQRQNALNDRLKNILDYLPIFDFATAIYAIGEYEAAIELFSKFLTQYPSREVYNNLGLCDYQLAYQLYADWKPDEIASNPNYLFRLSLQIDPVSQFRASTRAVNNQYKGLFLSAIKQAVENFKAAIQRDENYATALNNLGCAYLLNGDLNLAQGYLRQAIKMKPDLAEAYNNLGICLVAADQKEESPKYFNQAMEISPNQLHSLWNLCILNQLKGDIKQADESGLKYLQRDSTSRHAAALKKRLGKPVALTVFQSWQETIDQSSPLLMDRFTKEGWEVFQTVNAEFAYSKEKEKSYSNFRFKSKNSKKEIFLIRTMENYSGATAKNIQIGDSVERVNERYTIPFSVVVTTGGEYRIYHDPGLAFEIAGGKVAAWFLFDVL